MQFKSKGPSAHGRLQVFQGSRTFVFCLFLCPAGGCESPDPGKADKCAFHWPRTHKKWSCEGGAQIAASDCSADKTETVAETKIISLFGIRRSPLAS